MKSDANTEVIRLRQYRTQDEAIKALEMHAVKLGKRFMGGCITEKYLRKDEWEGL